MRSLFAALLSLAFAVAAQPMEAQEQASRFEAYGGYYYVRANINASVQGTPSSSNFNGNGGGGQLEYNLNHWLGVVGDLAGYAFTNTTNGALAGGAFSYLFGPRVNFRCRKVTPFAQALFGGFATTDGIVQSGDQNHFAMSTGGGIDFRVSAHVSIRPLQAEYFMTKIPDGLSNRQNNFRFGSGVVLRLGK